MHRWRHRGYDDGRFVGLIQTWTNCAGGESKLIHIAARPTAGAAFTAVLQILWTGPADEQALQTILGSFSSIPGAGPATQLGPVAPLTDALAIDPALLTTEVPDARNITDTSGRISVSAPASWTDTNSYGVIGDTGAERRLLDVAPDVAAFYDQWSVPGLSVVIYPTGPDPQTLLVNESWIWKDNCTAGDIVTVDTRGYRGYLRTWSGCGGTATRMTVAVLTAPGDAGTVLLTVQAPDADNTALQLALATLTIT